MMGKKFTLILLLVIVSLISVAADQGKSKSHWSNIYIIIIYIGFFALAIVVSVFIRRYRNGCLGAAVEANEQPREGEVTAGMDTEDIESLPSLRYSVIKLHKFSEEGERECAVCLNEFKDQEILRILPDCLHVFHPDCITPWLNSHVTCPVCRTSLDHRQGSSVSASSILERLSGVFSERFEGFSGILSSDLHDHHHNHDRDDDHINRASTAEIEERSSSLEVDLDGTRGDMTLVRCYSAGDVAIQIEGENGGISRRSDSLVDYSSLLVVNGLTLV